MSRALAYCAFLHAEEISLPQTGVAGAPVQVIAEGSLRLLWSEVEWPFRTDQLQKNAVEFHSVVSHIFRQKAVIPFRLLSVFDNAGALAAFALEHETAFVADLERLSGVVQMEAVVFPAPSQAQAGSSSGAEYLRRKALLLQSANAYARACVQSAEQLGGEVRVRESKNGTRIFVLVKRGEEDAFRGVLGAVPLPEHLSRRISGPWPAAEFLSDQVRSPQAARMK